MEKLRAASERGYSPKQHKFGRHLCAEVVRVGVICLGEMVIPIRIRLDGKWRRQG